MKALNDKFMLQDILAHLRDLMTASGLAIMHSNCPNMRSVVTTTSGRTTKHQFEVFQYMHDNGMYPVQNVGITEIQKVVNAHNRMDTKK